MGGAGEGITKCQDETPGSENYVYYLVCGDGIYIYMYTVFIHSLINSSIYSVNVVHSPLIIHYFLIS